MAKQKHDLDELMEVDPQAGTLSKQGDGEIQEESCEKKTIEDLPYEVLCYIFSFLTVRTVVWGVKQVCNRWSLVAQDNSLWRTKEHDVRFFDQREARTLSMASSNLQWINIYHHSRKEFLLEEVLVAIAENCPLLRGISLTMWQQMEETAFSLVVQRCVQLEKVEFIFASLERWSNLNILSSCKNLKRLRLLIRTTDCDIFNGIAEGCPQLQYLDLWHSEFCRHDLSHLLKTVGLQLKELSFTCCREDEHQYCAISDVASFCKSLEVLRIRRHEGSTHRLQEFLASGAARNMREMELCQFTDINEALLVALFKNCANLRSLKLREMKLQDKYMECIGQLTNLKMLELSEWNNLTDKAVISIVQCKKLTKFSFYACHRLTDISFVTCCLELPNLQELYLQNLAVTVESLLLVPKYLKKLQFLSVYGEHLTEAVMVVKNLMPNLKIICRT